MKLLQINTVYQNGSTGKICKQIDKEFRKAKLGESKIAYFWGDESNSDNVIKCATNKYAKLMALKSRITGEYGFVSKKSTKRLISLIDEYDPDIIHLHNIHDHALDLGDLFYYLQDCRSKIVWTFHDCWAYTGYCGHYSLEKCEKWIEKCGNCPLSRRYSWIKDKSDLLQSRKKILYGNRKFEIITPSKWLANEVKKSFLGLNNITVINNGIDLSIFKPVKSEFRERYSIYDKKIILGVAYQWDKRKGFDVFLQLSKMIGDDFVIVLVGNIPRDNTKLPNNVISIKRTSNQNELAAIYAVADVFVNTTREEVFGLVNVEALACGTPVITFNSGGSPECIDTTCGIVSDNEDVNLLYRNIIDVCDNGRFTSEGCIERASIFESSKMYQRYLDKYIEMIQR